VPPRRQQEMPFEQSLAGAKFGKDVFIKHGTGTLISKTSGSARDALGLQLVRMGIALWQFFPRGA
jgi:serine acetyltransferase